MFAGKKSAQIREILISESAWEEMTCLFAPSFAKTFKEEEKQYLACGEFSCTQMPFLSGLTKSTHGVDRRHA
ncbi:hypothetical protein EJS90_15530 [Klebsiella pneumoniae]|nr:hypothetical protein EJS90_15530 [Klebsiella pneumoniae]